MEAEDERFKSAIVAPPAKNTRTVGELVLDLREAHRRMGATNPHKALVGQAAFALVYLSQQVEHLKQVTAADRPPERRIVLAGEGMA